MASKGPVSAVNSPIARGLIGKELGDVALVKTPGGDVEYEIDAIKHIISN